MPGLDCRTVYCNDLDEVSRFIQKACWIKELTNGRKPHVILEGNNGSGKTTVTKLFQSSRHNVFDFYTSDDYDFLKEPYTFILDEEYIEKKKKLFKSDNPEQDLMLDLLIARDVIKDRTMFWSGKLSENLHKSRPVYLDRSSLSMYVYNKTSLVYCLKVGEIEGHWYPLEEKDNLLIFFLFKGKDEYVEPKKDRNSMYKELSEVLSDKYGFCCIDIVV